ncbi:hypothetical protein B0J13DRAFT_295919 [Dactylonectria estremocensis]|uniref:Uncharacterized protein n=1 Tax=Dactylonectria estremocensis TaxID=1079267 RepID=A0A9P9EZM1_9HYPO|nr:hypothetical protein B0J13DRAFT_295919 [Dactylonectria estremocensis]
MPSFLLPGLSWLPRSRISASGQPLESGPLVVACRPCCPGQCPPPTYAVILKSSLVFSGLLTCRIPTAVHQLEASTFGHHTDIAMSLRRSPQTPSTSKRRHLRHVFSLLIRHAGPDPCSINRSTFISLLRTCPTNTLSPNQTLYRLLRQSCLIQRQSVAGPLSAETADFVIGKVTSYFGHHSASNASPSSISPRPKRIFGIA